MSVHTPGPWKMGVNLAIVAQVESDRWIAVCDEGYAVPKSEQHANARLIAAAPELLRELEELYALVKGECPSLLNEDSGGNGEQDMRIADAIAKAKGNA